MFSWKKYLCEIGLVCGTGYAIGYAYGLFLVFLGNLLLTLVGITATKIILSLLFVLFIVGIFCGALFGHQKLSEAYENKTGEKTIHPIYDWIVLGYKSIWAKINGMTKVLVPATGEVRL